MREGDFDRILSKGPEIIPSPGFVEAVMDSVRRQATAPPPIPFPWKRALPGVSAVAFALVALFVAVATFLIHGSSNQSLPPTLALSLIAMLEMWKTLSATWVVLALVLSFASVRFSMRLTRGRTK